MTRTTDDTWTFVANAEPAQPDGAAVSEPTPAPSPRERAKRKKTRVTPVLKRLWILLIIIVVVAIAGFCVERLRGFFGSNNETTRPGSGLANDTKPFNPKRVKYEIFGPAGAVATINYLDLDAHPQEAKNVILPWSLTLTTTAPAASANIVAQGNGDSISCRITVNGEVKDENTTEGVNAETFCLVKSA
jgi:flagellar basal body-associated protein FliL